MAEWIRIQPLASDHTWALYVYINIVEFYHLHCQTAHGMLSLLHHRYTCAARRVHC